MDLVIEIAVAYYQKLALLCSCSSLLANLPVLSCQHCGGPEQSLSAAAVDSSADIKQKHLR